MDKVFKYKAFISYSRAADSRLAPEIKSALQRFAKPWYKLRVIQVFCDQTNLTVNPNLWGSIESNLNESEYFIYLASPQAAQSKWVKKEFQYFYSKGSADKIIIVLTDGNLVWNDEQSNFERVYTDVLPDFEVFPFTDEPLWLDLRWIRKEQLSFREPRFLDIIANLSATLRNIEKDVLIGKDVEEHRKAKRFRIITVSSLIFLVIFLIATTFFAIQSENRSQDRLVRTFIGNGVASLENNDYVMAFPWFMQAWVNERNSDKSQLNKFRVENLFSQIPQLVLVWKTELPILKTVFLNNGNILIVSGSSPDVDLDQFECVTNEKNSCRTEIRVISPETGSDVYPPISLYEGIRAISLNADKTMLGCINSQGKVRLWNLKHGKLVWQKNTKLADSIEIVESILFDRKNERLLLATAGSLEVYDIATNSLIASHQEEDYTDMVFDGVGNVHFLMNDEEIIFTNVGLLKKWNIRTGKVVVQKIPYMKYVAGLQISPDQKHLAISGAKETSVPEFVLTSLFAYVAIDAIQKPLFIKESGMPVTKFAFDSGGEVLATNSSEEKVDDGTRVWDVSTGAPLTGFIKLSAGVNMGFDTKGQNMVIGSLDGTTEVWKIGKGETPLNNARKLWLFHDAANSYINSIFSPENRFILTSGRFVKLWKIPNDSVIQSAIDKQEFESNSHIDDQWEAKFFHEGSYDSSVTNSAYVYIYDKKANKEVGILKHNSNVRFAAISRDNSIIVTSTVNEFNVWQREDQRKLCEIPLYNPADVRSIAIALDNKKIVILYSDMTFRIWDAKTGTPISPYKKHPFSSDVGQDEVVFSRDGKKILSSDGAIGFMLWDATTGDPLSAPVLLNNYMYDVLVLRIKQANHEKIVSSDFSKISFKDLMNYAELISNQKMDSGGSFVPISDQEYMDKWKKWKLVLGK